MVSDTSGECVDLSNELWNRNTIFLDPVSDVEVIFFLSLIVAAALDILAPCLTHIYNLYLTSTIFPEKMQIVKVTVLYKKGDKNNMGNHRPISILPVFSNGLEKVLHTHFINFTNEFDLITYLQYGFQKHCSIELALLAQKELILQSIEDENTVLGAFIDFTKAFDYLNHRLLLEKLDRYWFSGALIRTCQIVPK